MSFIRCRLLLSLLLVSGSVWAKPDLLVDSRNSPWNALSDEALRAEAKAVVTNAPAAVTDKRRVPESGDRHDFMSVGPYWWPNDFTTNGLPYVRRDGVVNPESLEDSDHNRSQQLVRDVSVLAAARWRLGDAAAGREAVRRLRIFFLDERTRMNPHMDYGQAIPGICKGRGIGIIDLWIFAGTLLDAIEILRDSGDLTAADLQGLKTWFARFLVWLQTSPNGQDEAKALNNHGTAWSVQAVAYAIFTGQDELARKLLREARDIRIGPQVAPNGMQTFELNRTRSFSYSTYNVTMLCLLARFGERMGVDLRNHVAPNGASIAKAVEWMVPYWRREKPWTYEQCITFEKDSERNGLATWKHFGEKVPTAVSVTPPSLAETMEAVWTDTLRNNWDRLVNHLYEKPQNLLPQPNEIVRDPNSGGPRGSGMESCLENCSVMLLAALARWDRTQDAESARVAALMADAVTRCSEVSGTPGLVVKAICPFDQKSFYRFDTYDHYTVYAYALWKAHAHPLAAKLGWKAKFERFSSAAADYVAKRRLPLSEVAAADRLMREARAFRLGGSDRRPVCQDLAEAVRRQLADRLFYEEEPSTLKREALKRKMRERVALVREKLCTTGRLDAMFRVAEPNLYAPYDSDFAEVRDYVREVGQRMMVQALCPGWTIPAEDIADFTCRMQKVDFTKPCWWPPVWALWYYWSDGGAGR